MFLIRSIIFFTINSSLHCLLSEDKTGNNSPDVTDIFGDLTCIEEPENFFTEYYQIPSLDYEPKYVDKTYRAQVNELIQYHNLDFSYVLESEKDVPPHKIFNMSLRLGDEIHYGYGKNKREAKEMASKYAWENTMYQKPPANIKNHSLRDQNSPPTVILNNLGYRHGYHIKYFIVDPLMPTKRIIKLENEKNIQLTNSSFWKVAANLDEPPKSPFMVEVEVEDRSFFGKGHTIQSAKHNSASEAIKSLKELKMDKESRCTIKGKEYECQEAKIKLKSPISQVYEFATSHRFNLEFSEVGKTGPPHKPIFEFKCTLGTISTTAEGKSKREAKTNSAEKMLENLPITEHTPNKLDRGKSKTKTRNKNKMSGYVLNTAKEAVNKIMTLFVNDEGESSNDDKVENESSTKSTKKQKRKGKGDWSPKEKLLEVGKTLNLDFQFYPFPSKNTGFHTVVNVNLNPKYICYGSGNNVQIAQEYAALNTLKFLYKLDLVDNIAESDLDINRFSFDTFIWLAKDHSSEL